jgi:hypothetical protein
VVKRTLRPGLGLAERSPRPPFGGGENEMWGVGEKTRWMRLEFDMRWDLSVLQ